VRVEQVEFYPNFHVCFVATKHNSLIVDPVVYGSCSIILITESVWCDYVFQTQLYVT